jgi:hypothetical protein
MMNPEKNKAAPKPLRLPKAAWKTLTCASSNSSAGNQRNELMFNFISAKE